MSNLISNSQLLLTVLAATALPVNCVYFAEAVDDADGVTLYVDPQNGATVINKQVNVGCYDPNDDTTTGRGANVTSNTEVCTVSPTQLRVKGYATGASLYDIALSIPNPRYAAGKTCTVTFNKPENDYCGKIESSTLTYNVYARPTEPALISTVNDPQNRYFTSSVPGMFADAWRRDTGYANNCTMGLEKVEVQRNALLPWCTKGDGGNETYTFNLAAQLNPLAVRRAEITSGTKKYLGDPLYVDMKVRGHLGNAVNDPNQWHVIWQAKTVQGGTSFNSPYALGLQVSRGKLRLVGKVDQNNRWFDKALVDWQDDTVYHIAMSVNALSTSAQTDVYVMVNNQQFTFKTNTFSQGADYLKPKAGLYRGVNGVDRNAPSSTAPTYEQWMTLDITSLS